MNLTLKDLIGYFRLDISVFGTSFGAVAYLLVSPPGFRLLPVLSSCFFLTAFTYSLNRLFDREEDRANDNTETTLTDSNVGPFLTFVCLVLGILSAYYISFPALSIAAFGAFLGGTYSFFRLKRFFLLKNLYTTSGLSLLVLLGFAGAGEFGQGALFYATFILFLFLASIVSDMRDYYGDKITNLRTLPVRIGLKKTRKVISGAFAAQGLALSVVGAYPYHILSAFALVISGAVYMGRYRIAHKLSGLCFLFLAVLLFFSKAYPGIL